MRRRQASGMTYVEVLVAVLLVSVAAASAFATWVLSSKAPANKRNIEMGVYIATTEIERMKALKYNGLTDNGTIYTSSGTNIPGGTATIRYYDATGTYKSTQPSVGYQAKIWVTPILDRNGRTDGEDLREIRVQVWNVAGTAMYEDARTLLTLGGL